MALSSGQAEYVKSKLGFLSRRAASPRRGSAPAGGLRPCVSRTEDLQLQTRRNPGLSRGKKGLGPGRHGITFEASSIHFFFDYAANPERGWTAVNPVKGIVQRDVPEGSSGDQNSRRDCRIVHVSSGIYRGSAKPNASGLSDPLFCASDLCRSTAIDSGWRTLEDGPRSGRGPLGRRASQCGSNYTGDRQDGSNTPGKNAPEPWRLASGLSIGGSSTCHAQYVGDANRHKGKVHARA